MILFYREDNGDYLAIDSVSNRYFLEIFGKDQFEGRATAIAGLVGSVCTCGISRQFLRARCEKVSKASVPTDWAKAIGY